MCNNNQDCKCISDILKVILILQKKFKGADVLDSCDRDFLGGENCGVKCNTRPIQLFLACANGNDPLVMPTTKEPITETTCFSDVFRIEKLDECCATFRVLVPNKHSGHDKSNKFVGTESLFTLDLRCVCAIKCLDDTFIDCV